LNSKAIILIQAGRHKEALPILDHLLTRTNLPAARLNRAFARLGEQDFAGAENDFRELQTNNLAPGPVNLGLAIVAEQRHDTNRAAQLLRMSLTNLPMGTPMWQQASLRLQLLSPK